jgi:PKD repeat protein
VTGPLEAVAVDGDGRVRRTLDRGATWNAAAPLPLALEAKDVHFVSANDGFVVGAGFEGSAIFRTEDGGATWQPTDEVEGLWVAIDFAGTSGWALRYDGATLRTVDGGGSWNEGATLPAAPTGMTDVEFWNGSTGYAAGSAGYVARSGNGGATWQILPTPDAGADFTDVHLLGPDDLWLVAADGTAWFSANAGQNWSLLASAADGFPQFAAIVTTATAGPWIVGNRGAISRWEGPIPPPSNRPPEAAFDYVAFGLSVAFTDASVDSDGSIVAWSWSFGDGSTSTEANPTHAYAAAGTYLVNLTVTDDDGDSDSAGAAIAVQPLPGGTFGEFTEVTPLDPLFVTPENEDFWVATTAPADVDGDGDLDVAVLGFYVVYNESVVDRLVLLINGGAADEDTWDFSYVDVPLGDLVTGASDLAWGDVDGDGDPDLVVGSEGATVLYRNAGGVLTATGTVLPPYWEDNFQADFDLRSITWADFDNDGDLDLLLPSVWDDEAFEFRTALLRNDGADGSGGFLFVEVDAGFPPTAHAQSQWADFDGDQDLDLLLTHLAPLTDEGFIRRYRNDGDGLFVGEEILGALAIEHGEAQWGDYDDDGDLDILVAGNVRELDGTYTAQALRIYRDDGADTFTQVDVLDCPQCDGWFDLSAATWADYDSDGDIDILLAGTWNPGSQIEGRAKILANVDGTFFPAEEQLPAPRSMGDRGGAFSWLDLDGEGDLDYFVAGSYFVPGGNGLVEAQMHVYRNDATADNAPPSPPGNLAAAVTPGGSVALGWTPASDDSTPAEALTYELRLRRGGAPSALSRHLPEPGGLSAVEEWTLTGLPDGYYRWSLAAVDSAYNSGPAASGGFFVGDPDLFVFADGFESGDGSAWSFETP